MERTFALIKPDAVADKLTGKIIDLIELNGFTIAGLKKVKLSKNQAETFYAIHKERPWFGELISYMTSGAVVLMLLEKTDAVNAWRTLMGATNPEMAQVGTIRRMFGKNIGSNATHGSDSQENAEIECKFFFPELI